MKYGYRERFLNLTSKAQTKKKNINEFDYIQIKIFCKQRYHKKSEITNNILEKIYL